MSIEPHTSPTVEAVASLQKEAERVLEASKAQQALAEGYLTALDRGALPPDYDSNSKT